MNKLIIGDNLTILKTLADNSIDAVYTDPPYLTGNTKLTYKDNHSEEEWITFITDRLIEVKRVMKPSATMLIHIDENMHIELATIINKVFGKKNHITTFCWKKRSSASNQSKFATQEHEYIIAVAKDIKKAKWNGIPQFESPTIDGKKTSEAGWTENMFNDDVGEYKEQRSFVILGGNGGERKTQTYPLYHGDDPNDITTELKRTGKNSEPR